MFGSISISQAAALLNEDGQGLRAIVVTEGEYDVPTDVYCVIVSCLAVHAHQTAHRVLGEKSHPIYMPWDTHMTLSNQ